MTIKLSVIARSPQARVDFVVSGHDVSDAFKEIPTTAANLGMGLANFGFPIEYTVNIIP